MSKDLTELPGKEVLMLTVEYPSSTKPAKFVVFFIKDKGAPVLVPVQE